MAAPHSPPASPSRPAPAASSSTPHASIPYSSSFASSLANAVLRPSTTNDAAASTRNVRITPSVSSSTAAQSQPTSTTSATGNTVPISSIAFSTLPIIPPTDLPLPLDDTRRVYESVVPGVRLTHPGGWLEGGAGTGAGTRPLSAADFRIALTETGAPRDPVPSRSMGGGSEEDAYTTYLSRLITPTNTNTNTTPSSMKQAIRAALAAEAEAQLEELRTRVRAREEAKRKNEEIERKVEELEAQRRIERRVEEGWRRRGRV